jgi:hypothetical protein
VAAFQLSENGDEHLHVDSSAAMTPHFSWSTIIAHGFSPLRFLFLTRTFPVELSAAVSFRITLSKMFVNAQISFDLHFLAGLFTVFLYFSSTSLACFQFSHGDFVTLPPVQRTHPRGSHNFEPPITIPRSFNFHIPCQQF